MVQDTKEMPKKQRNEARKPASRNATVRPPKNPNKRPTIVSAERSMARLRAENRAVIYGYHE